MIIITSSDYHQSEYVGEYFRAIEFMTGFTGENAVAVFDDAGGHLWVDGRFFIQAPLETAGKNIEIMKMGVQGVPTLMEYIDSTLKAGNVLQFDGRTVPVKVGLSFKQLAVKHGAIIDYENDPIASKWTNRPSLPTEPAWELDVKYAGETVASKLSRIREEMSQCGAAAHIVTTLDDINWMLNIRGNDISYFPMVLCYAIVYMDHVDLYADETKFNNELKISLKDVGVSIHPYNDIYEDVKGLSEGTSVMIDPERLNYTLYNNIPDGVHKIEKRNPEILMKAVKNEVELENIKIAQLKDSIAHVKFMKWVKENYDRKEITEITAMEQLEELRSERGNYIHPSFESISAMGEHAAIIHYTSTSKTDCRLCDGLYLTDTGAGYYEGSTDITRTYALGEISQDKKEHFTAVVKSNLHLANAIFEESTNGAELDQIARQQIQNLGLDYNHGTGHGVGYLLNIHEDPFGFSHSMGVRARESLVPGVVVTDEPGVYIEGSHGIRLENELLCCKGEKQGELYFEILTYIPFDLDAIDAELMTDEEKSWLNDYHKKVYEVISPYLNEEEKLWLGRYTRMVG